MDRELLLFLLGHARIDELVVPQHGRTALVAVFLGLRREEQLVFPSVLGHLHPADEALLHHVLDEHGDGRIGEMHMILQRFLRHHLAGVPVDIGDHQKLPQGEAVLAGDMVRPVHDGIPDIAQHEGQERLVLIEEIRCFQYGRIFHGVFPPLAQKPFRIVYDIFFLPSR